MRIGVRAAAVSPTDTYVRNGARTEAQGAVGPPPYVPGMDAAGVLEEIGEGVQTDVSLGDHVMAIVVPKGSHGAVSACSLGSVVAAALNFRGAPPWVDDPAQVA